MCIGSPKPQAPSRISGQVARRPDIDAGLHELGDVEVRFEATVEIAHCATAEIQHLEACCRSELCAERIEHGWRHQRALLGKQIAERLRCGHRCLSFARW